MDPCTRERIRAQGISVWLRADLEVLLSRVARRDNRPLLKVGDPREILGRLIDERYPVYAEADVTVMTGDAPHLRVVEDICHRLRELAAHRRHATTRDS